MPRTLSTSRSLRCEANLDVSAADKARADTREVCEAGRFVRLIEVQGGEHTPADVPLTMGEVRLLLARNLRPSGRPDGSAWYCPRTKNPSLKYMDSQYDLGYDYDP